MLNPEQNKVTINIINAKSAHFVYASFLCKIHDMVLKHSGLHV